MRTLVYLMLLMPVLSCRNPGPQVPDDVLPREKMAQILLDIHLLEAAANLNELDGDQKDHYRLYAFVFEKHGISRGKYDSSFTFYSGHPELFEKIYQDVIQRLSTLQGEESKR